MRHLRKILECVAATISLLLIVSCGGDSSSDDNSHKMTVFSTGAEHTMALREDGSLWAWGYNDSGVFGDGTTASDSLVPIKIMDSVVSVSAGAFHTMVIKEDGSLWAWGQYEEGYIETMPDYDPVPIKIMDSVASVSAGWGLSAAVGKDGSLWVFKRPSEDEYGGEVDVDGVRAMAPYSDVPMKIMDSVVSVSAGAGHIMAIRKDGSLWALGNNYSGELGNSTTAAGYPEASLVPVKIMDSVVSVSAGMNYTMAIREDGSLWGWGNNEFGKLGDGTTINRFVPVKIMDSVASVSTGQYHTMALKKDGSLWAWGYNGWGVLGDGTTISRLVPVKIMDSVASLSTGGGGFASHTIVVRKDGSLWAWGVSEWGGRGDGSTEVECIRPVKIDPWKLSPR